MSEPVELDPAEETRRMLRIRAHYAAEFYVTKDEFWVLSGEIESLRRQLDDVREFLRGVARNLVAAAGV